MRVDCLSEDEQNFNYFSNINNLPETSEMITIKSSIVVFQRVASYNKNNSANL